MKAMIYGRELLARRIQENLLEHGITSITVADTPDAAAFIARCEKPDVVLVDSKAKGAIDITRFLRQSWNPCIALITGNDPNDWDGIENFTVNGYVPDRINNGELKARLIAIQRRWRLAAAQPINEQEVTA